MTSVAVNTYTHSVTYVADNILKSLKDIIRLSGLDPSEFVGDWETHMRGVQTWLNTGVLKSSEGHYRSKAPSVVLTDFHNALVEIPDNDLGRWIKTNPKIHAEKATAAHQAYSNEWKGLVRMVKYWNNNPKHGEKPVKPSFLIEVMALQCLYGGWGGSFDREMQGFFATLADRILDEWPDPAGLGPAISNGMDTARKTRARELLRAAEREATLAIDHARPGYEPAAASRSNPGRCSTEGRRPAMANDPAASAILVPGRDNRSRRT